MDINLVSCRGLTKAYGRVSALSDCDLELKSGRITGLLGPCGSGKTTLIKLIAGLLTPSDGLVSVLGHTAGAQTKAMVSYLPEKMYFDRYMSVSEYIELFSDFYKDFDAKRARNLLDRMRVPLSVRLAKLSQGACKKAGLALAMSRRAKLYLLDEPMDGIDPAARSVVLDTILSNQGDDVAILIATNSIQDVESIIDDVVFLSESRVVMHDDADSIRAKFNLSLNELFREAFKC